MTEISKEVGNCPLCTGKSSDGSNATCQCVGAKLPQDPSGLPVVFTLAFLPTSPFPLPLVGKDD